MFKLTVILFVLISLAYSLILSVTKLRSANNPTPASVSDIYDAETYIKWRKYSKEHCLLDLVSNVVTAVIMLAFLAFNVHSAFASLFPGGMELQLIAVLILEIGVSTLVGIVTSYISTMVIEQKYGFNRSSIKTFIFDVIRSLVVNCILSLSLANLMTVFEYGDWPIFVFAAVVFLATLVGAVIYPYLSRIGNKFTPLEDGELKTRLMEMLTRHGYKIKSIKVMDASRRTTKVNAYIAGLGKTKTIVLYDNLIEKMTPDEICAIFAHEMGHGLHKDVLKGQMLNIGYVSVLSLVVWAAVRQPGLYTELGFEGINYGFAYVLASIGLGLIQPLMSLAINARSRAAEYAADRQAVEEGYGEHMITAFKKMAKDNFANLSPSRINVVLEYSHPPIHSRIEAVREAMKKVETDLAE